MKNILNIALLIAMGLFLNSCYYDAFPEDEDNPTPVVPVEDVSYASDIAPLLGKCLGCHTSSNTLNLTDNAYTNIVKIVVPGNSEDSKFYNYLPGNGHFDIGFTLSKEDIALVKSWIDEGALNN